MRERLSHAGRHHRADPGSRTWQPALWGGDALIRAWGRLPGPGRSLTRFYPDRAAAQPEVERLIARRLRRGYTLASWL